ncbi:ATP-binding protein [Kribbella sp. DT2]|uniref:ATP-binding protein n=1 Tax=Kribbella sp. DT2 TaxID=3393427 RepID=UPI003CEE0651
MNELPDPDGVTDLDDLVGQLRLLKVWAGSPSYDVIARQIAERRGQPARKSTVADCFRLGRRRMDAELLLDIVATLHADSGYVARWQHALRVVTGESAASAHVSVEEVLPEDLAGFTGRTAELDRLRDVLVASQSEGNAVVISAIEGMAGVGKTRFAVHAGHLLAAAEPFEQVLFVNLRGFHQDPQQPPADPAAVLDGFLRRLNVPASRIPHGLAARTAVYRERLAGTRTLVVLDNAATEEQVRPLLPQTAGCLTMITSRRGLTGLPHTTRFEIDVFTRDEAVGYLTRNLPDLPPGEDPTAADRIAARCGFLPLALSLVTAYIGTTTGWTLTDHADRLDERHDNHRIDDAVEVALALSYEGLPDRHRRILRMLALHPGADFDGYAAAALADTSLPVAELTLEELARDHLLQQTTPDRYTFHDLVRAFATVKGMDEDRPGDRRGALTRLFDYYLATCSVCMDVLHPAYRDRRPKVATPSTELPGLSDRSDAVGWLATERSNLMAVVEHTSQNGWLMHASHLSMTLGRYLMGVHASDAMTISSHALRAAVAAGDLIGEAYALNNLGIAWARTFEFHRAIELHEQARDKFAAAGDAIGEAGAYNALGTHYTQLSDWDRSRENFERGLAVFGSVGDRLGEALILSNLANNHKRTARYGKALEVLDRALSIYTEVDVIDGRAAVLTNLCVVAERQGRYADALTHSRQALELYRRIGNRTGEARALQGLGVAEVRTRAYDDAREHLIEGLEIYRHTGIRGGEGGALDTLGELCTATGDTARAVQHHQDALLIYRETAAYDHESYALNGIGEAVHTAGDSEQAVTHHTEALAIASKYDISMEQARAHAGLARAHRSLGSIAAADEQDRLATSIYTTLDVPPPAYNAPS